MRGSISDISDRKRGEDRQQRLFRELNHRVKNTLSSIITLARQSIGRSRSLIDFEQTFTGRLTAMSRAHEAITSAQWDHTDLDGLARLVLAPHLISRSPQISMGGERISLPAWMVVPLGMTLHELATNALKHGALSTNRGKVEVRWRESGGSLEITWREQNAPPMRRPMIEGTGIDLIRGFIVYELRGKVRFDPQPDGVTTMLQMPLTV